MTRPAKERQNIPIWQREKRPPTRAELAAKYFADGGTLPTIAGNTLPDDELAGAEYELAPLSDTNPNILIRRPKAPTTKSN